MCTRNSMECGNSYITTIGFEERGLLHHLKHPPAEASAIPFDRAEFTQRYERLQASLDRNGLDTFLCFSPENIYYITGFQTLGYYFPQCLVCPHGEAPTLVLREFERPGVAAMTWLEHSRGFLDHQDPADVIAEVVAAHGGARVGFEADSWFLTPALLARMQARLTTPAVPVEGLVELQRLVKSPAEITMIRRAAHHTDAAMAAAFAASRVGVTEDEVAGETYRAMIEDGSSYPSLPPFIATGARTADPQATWSGRVLQAGDPLFYETGASEGRYGAALIRMGVLGEPPAEIRDTMTRADATVQTALQALVAAVRPGISAEAVARVARDVLEGEGWGDFNTIRSGYSIGISFPPDWGEGHILSLRAGEQRVLEAGMVFHIVPSLLIPGVGGFGVSDTVLVTDSGCECLTRFPRELVVL